VLQSAGLLFFAFAGYARIATMGEEVRDPQHTIPRAIVVALATTVAVYAVVAVAVLLGLGPDRLATSRAPLADVVAGGDWAWAMPVVVVGGAAAALGALLALSRGSAAPRWPWPGRPTCPAGWPRFIRATGHHTVPRSPSP
jgi:basic amino acid/polyamine antiporter, APA family